MPGVKVRQYSSTLKMGGEGDCSGGQFQAFGNEYLHNAKMSENSGNVKVLTTNYVSECLKIPNNNIPKIHCKLNVDLFGSVKN